MDVQQPKKGKIVLIIISCIAVLSVILLLLLPKTDGSTLTVHKASDNYHMVNSARENSYFSFLASHESTAIGQSTFTIPAAQFTSKSSDEIYVVENYEGMKGASLYTSETGEVEWQFNVPANTSGLYALEVHYYPVEGKSSAIEREIAINGEVQFEEAKYVQFDRLWVNELDYIKKDNQGNELRPRQIEAPAWIDLYVKDSNGYTTEPFLFYLQPGMNTLTFKSSREPMMIHELRFKNVDVLPSYEEVKASYAALGYKPAANQNIKIEAEQASLKSSPTLYPLSERTNPAVNPYSPSEVKINTIGGYNWRLPGQWIEWEFEVEEEGLYNIGFLTQQNWKRGMYSTRKLYIDGKVPFSEMSAVGFKYDSGYRLETIGTEEEDYLFYLAPGKHTLRMEMTLGPFAEMIADVEDSLYQLNTIYRSILMITGTKPDEFRDYQLTNKIPNLLESLAYEQGRLEVIAEQLEGLSNGSSEQEALLKTMVVSLGEMMEKPENIHRKISEFKINAGGLGTWVQQARIQPLEFDSIYITAPEANVKVNGLSTLAKLGHEIRTFFYSFFIDYNSIGNVTDAKDQRSITVWIGTGRDQANTMKAMIDETFTPETGINVNLRLVQMHTLLPATLAGQGPDVAMQIENDVPVNFAMRHAAADLTQFSDYEDVLTRFRESAIVPYSYDGGVYALAEEQTFNMLFYRKDVLEELGLDIPTTWEEMEELLSVLSKNKLSFGFPQVVQPTVQGQNIPPNSIFAALLFQNGGEFYREDGKETALDTRVAIETFKKWTEYYTDYKLEREYDFANRFRTGEMPIGISDYTVYNTLTVSAPEIRGLWGFAPIPGTPQADGTVNNVVPSGGRAVMMLENAEDKEAAWEFIKWWTSDDVQVKYGREMEALMGAAARYPTANINALDSLPWPVEDYKQLKSQFEHVVGIPEVPGGYFTGRHLFNAFYKSVSGEIEARVALMDYVEYIQAEIDNKRIEFNLD